MRTIITLLALWMILLLPARAVGRPCASLTELLLPDMTITTASEIAAGQFIPPSAKDPLPAPAFCRVVGVAKPASDSVIHFEVWLPPARAWNGKFEGVGNSGYNGSVSYGAMAEALDRGYATASTDTGHSGSDLKFAAGRSEKITDWGYRAVHVMTEAAKLVIRDYEGRFPQHSYFNGCSTGGAQGLSEAQRFPSDYDGIVAGAPGNDRTHLTAGFLWAYAAAHRDKSGLPTSKLRMINQAVLAACDALDGIRDGIIEDPRRCRFDPGTLLCQGADNGQCLTPAQVEAVRRIYAGPKNPRTGGQIIAGYAPGSESPAGDPFGGWKTYITGVAEPMRLDFWRYWAFNDPEWDWRTFDFDLDLAYADKKLAAVNATDPDLARFQARGGKLIVYQGWADPVSPAQAAINYYERVMRTMGGAGRTQEFFRLFMAPGMSHCYGGPGPTIFGGAGGGNARPVSPPGNRDPEHDVLSALDRWVEHGTPPRRLIASHLTGGVVDRTRPVCPYPRVTRWKASGSSDDARNFACVDPEP
jgi:feruloyl esterase